MCLSVIKREIPNPTQKQYAAWKVFYKTEGKPLEADTKLPVGILISTHWGHDGNGTRKHVPVNHWLQAASCTVRTNRITSRYYQTGFHVYRTRADAERGVSAGLIYANDRKKVILRVAVRGITYVGEQDGCSVLVAREMYVKREGV